MWPWLLSLLDRQVPSSLRDEPEARRRVMLTLGITITTAIICAISIPVFVATISDPAIRDLAILNTTIATLLLLATVPLLHRLGLAWAAHWLALILILAFEYAVLVGGMFSPLVVGFPLIPVMAALIGGRGPGIMWTIVCIAGLGFGYATNHSEPEQIALIARMFEHPSLVTTIMASFTILLVSLFVMFSESTNRSLLGRLSVANRLLEAERARSDALLLNVLPGPIADRLRAGVSTIADFHTDATVLFADIVGFTPMAARAGAGEVVEFLDRVFSRLDALVAAYGLEKIKTIGDAYMVAGGLTGTPAGQASTVAAMALAMQAALAEIRRPDGEPVVLRIGIHTGPLVAGVIGTRRLLYDLWGDTVNLASRMESHGSPGRIHVSATTRDLLATTHEFSEPQEVEIKGKGKTTTYFLLGARVWPERDATTST